MDPILTEICIYIYREREREREIVSLKRIGRGREIISLR